MTTFPASTLHRVTSTCGRHLCPNRLPRNCCRMPWGAARSTIRWPKPSSWMSPSPLTRREHSRNLHSPIDVVGSNSAVLEVHMTRRTIGLISIILAVVVGIGALVAVPAVYAETKTVAAKQSVTAKRTLTPADKANLQTLKALYKQIGDTAKLIRDKVKADKAAGKDLTAFTTDLRTALKDATHRAVPRGIMLTEAERTALATMQTSIRTLEKLLKTQRKAKALQATLDTLKVQIKTAIAARTAYLKTIHTAALTQYSSRLVTLIADANVKLTFLQGLLTKLTNLP